MSGSTHPPGARTPRRRRRTAVLPVLLALTWGVLTGCAPSEDDAASSEPALTLSTQDCSADALPVLTDGELTVATDEPAYPPWFMNDDPANGLGFESALMYAVAQQLGFERDDVTWVRVPFTSVTAPDAKGFDVAVAQVSITAERREAVDFSSAYYDVTPAVVTVAGSPIERAATLADLHAATLGAQAGTTGQSTITSVIRPATEPAVFDRIDEATTALTNGEIGGLVVDLPTAIHLAVEELDGGLVVGQVPTAGGAPEQLGLVLERESPLTACVSAAVDSLRADGVLEQLEELWLTDGAGVPVLR